jgi:hypothetical protein
MRQYQERVIAERTELQVRYTRLTAFFDSMLYATLPIAEKDRLQRQSAVMMAYLAILDERIAAFT